MIIRGQCTADDSAFFESRIRPLLVRRCYACHSVDAKQQGGLVLDSRSGWTIGGDNGPAIKPENPDDSLLIKAVRWNDEALQMPPRDGGGKLSDAEIADLEAWVKQGAFDPRTQVQGGGQQKSWEETFAERKQWWSLRPVQSQEVPVVEDARWSTTAIDRFLLSKMMSEGVAAAGDASPQTLIRRASLVLSGLPPSSEELARFVADYHQDPAAAYVALVDRLLESPQFGERFARHWLDVVRFTETHGNEWNYDVPFAWRYRDYVIRAFNQDVPYDQFVREHVAGDLLPHPRWNAAGDFNESVIGTAHYRFGELNHDSCVEFGFGIIGYDQLDNQLDALTKAFQATTVTCARCHDHKMDAISTQDYHALLGILRSSRPVLHTLDGPEVNAVGIAKLKAQKTDLRAELATAWRDDLPSIDAGKLQALVDGAKEKPPTLESPLYGWLKMSQLGEAGQELGDSWRALHTEYEQESMSRAEFNRTNFIPIADFREGAPDGWFTAGMGLRDGVGASGDFAVATEGDAAVKGLLSKGLFTFAVSDKLNGALRSPTIDRKASNLSLEVVGGRSSFSRMVFNNCQLNYTHQQSLHYDDWTWVTIKYDENTEQLHPYLEFGTFWESPKFPDPIAILSKDTENQRQPWAVHAQNPRTWWGVRRVVMHDGEQPPKDEMAYLGRLYLSDAPTTQSELADKYRRIAGEAVDAFASNQASDDDVRWLDWFLKSGLLSNRADATPRLNELITRYRDVERDQISSPRVTPGMADEGPGFSQPVLISGEPNRPGETVDRHYLTMLSDVETALPIEADYSSKNLAGSGRRIVAEQMASPANSLTARVMVNRIWQWVYGRGLVRTVDDFGHMGEQPSHPELLDHLAAQFVAKQWSTKWLVRELLLTQAFRTAGAPTESARERDPENILLSHYPARRAEAEVIRDSVLAVSGRLDGAMYGPSVHPFREQADPEKRLYVGPLDGDGRRSIYIKFQLMEAPRFLRAFNLPGGKVTQGRRDVSNVPAQSLAMLNDPFVWAMADAWAARLVLDGCATPYDRVDAMFLSSLGRAASESERVRFVETIRTFAQRHDVTADSLMTSQIVWKEAAHTVFNFKEFIFIP